MHPIWKVLAAIDLNRYSDVAVQHAIDFANAMAGELFLLNVVEHASYEQTRAVDWPPQAVCGPIHRIVLPGDPAITICRYADFINADVVLLTPRLNGHWMRPWRGSVAADVLKSTRRAVQISDLRRLDAGYRFRCRKLLCVLNLDGTDDPLIDCATLMAARSGADIAILHVLPETSEGLLAWQVAQLDRPLSRAVALGRIRDLSDTLPPSYTTAIMAGPLHKSIAVAAKQSSADIIIVGRDMPGAWAPGSADAVAVLRQAICPVLSVPVASPARAEAEPIQRYRRSPRENVLCDI